MVESTGQFRVLVIDPRRGDDDDVEEPGARV